MKRREFLATPALGALLPGSTLLGITAPGAPDPHPRKTLPPEEVTEQRMHADFRTYLPGIEYFYLGNGDIQGSVQYCPKDPRGSFFGFTLMDPEHFCRKWSTFLYHPEKGLGNTRLGVTVGESRSPHDNASGMYFGVKGYAVAPDNFLDIAWTYPEGVPTIALRWNAGSCEITEEFFVPAEGALLFRTITVRNHGDKNVDVTLSVSLYANFGLFDRISTNEKERTANASGLAVMKLLALGKDVSVAGRYDVRIRMGTVRSKEKGKATFLYSINNGERLLRKKSFARVWRETIDYWKARGSFTTGQPLVDHLFRVSRTGIKAVTARSGRMDAGTWMYNMEWLSDHILAMEAMLRAGFVREARVLLENNLRHAIGQDGRTIESGRWFGYEYTEINQNGILLYGVWAYLCWTGDSSLIRRYWDQIRLCGDFPLRDVFLDARTHMVRNKREFWERSDTYGIEDGYELAYQFWVAFGLAKGAAVALLIGDRRTSERWKAASQAMQNAMLNDPAYKLIEDGHLIKRRTTDGRWQQFAIPPNRGRMPPGAPIATGEHPSLEPDTITLLPIIYEMIDPRSDLAARTLAWVERLWNQRWDTGGYPRYNVESEDNPPAPWPIPSMLVAHAYAAAGEDTKVRRVLEWLGAVHGGNSGGWFERYGDSITPPMPPVGVVGWIWYEIIGLMVHSVAGLRPELDHLVVTPRLLEGMNQVTTRHQLRGSLVNLAVHRSGGARSASVNGKTVSLRDGALRLPYPLGKEINVEFRV